MTFIKCSITQRDEFYQISFNPLVYITVTELYYRIVSRNMPLFKNTLKVSLIASALRLLRNNILLAKVTPQYRPQHNYLLVAS